MALGRGLDELLGEIESAYEDNLTTNETNEMISEISLENLMPNPYQPRKIFDNEKLNELSLSIKENGILQPIIVTKSDDKYMIIAGERRYRASKLANKKTIKAIVIDIDDKKIRQYSLMENIQRDDLNVLEIAYSYSSLINEHNITHDELSSIVHKSRSSISNILRLLNLSVYAQQKISENKISLGHAKLIVTLEETIQNKIVDSIIGQKLSVAQTSDLIKNLKSKKIDKKENRNKSELNFNKLNLILKKLNDDKLNVKLSKNKLSFTINTQNDIDKLLQYFS